LRLVDNLYILVTAFVIPIDAVYARDGIWVIRERPLRVKVRCPHCKRVLTGRTEPKYHLPPPTVSTKGMPPQY
jgi:hypothetical protein